MNESEIITAREELRKQFSRANDHPSVGEKLSEIQSNFQKLRVGSSPAYPLNTRLVRTFHNPLWEKDIYAMHTIFRKMIALRNKLIDKHKDFASNCIEDGFWTAAKILQYPQGGGFMSPHRDTPVNKVAEDAGLEFVQLILIMSQKGVDYERGGAYIHENGEPFIFEDFCKLGDIAVYNGSSIHGVQDIDPHKPLDLETFSGRVVALAALFKDLGTT